MTSTVQDTREFDEPIQLDGVRFEKKSVREGKYSLAMVVPKHGMPDFQKVALDDLTDSNVYARVTIERLIRRDYGEAPSADENQLDLIDDNEDENQTEENSDTGSPEGDGETEGEGESGDDF